MNAGTPLQNFERAEKLPNGSLYFVEMGDGSGSKAVTQETLVEETGKALNIGNFEELQTENKGSLVAAINEAAQSGGGGTSVDILDTREEIEANTETGKAAGAAAVKEMFAELNDNMANGQISFSVVDGEPYVKVGADSPRPFNSFSSTKISEKVTISTIEKAYILPPSRQLIGIDTCRQYGAGGGNYGDQTVKCDIKNNKITREGGNPTIEVTYFYI